MPLKPERRAAYMREYRAKQRAELTPVPDAIPAFPDDPATVLAEWSRDNLIVPPGHPAAGEPLILPDYLINFFYDVFLNRESLLCISRKNAKSAGVAVFLLARLAGPLRIPGYRAGVVSVSREKAGELKMLMQAIAEASELDGLSFMRSPAPGHVLSAWGGRVDILSADRSSGHASGFDDAIIDELGLLSEGDRELVNGMRSAISARDGRFVALSVQGPAPFTAEMLERKGQPGLAVHHYRADPDCDIDNREAWIKANPGLPAGIKSMNYMADECRRVLATPADQNSFKVYDLNIPVDPAKTPVISVESWKGITTEHPAEMRGPCVIGVDLGGSASMTAAAVVWLETGRLAVWGAFPDDPDLITRGKVDKARYQDMQERGELSVYPGKSTPAVPFLRTIFERIRQFPIMALGCDRYRKADLEDTITASGFHVRQIELRGMGASATADGSADIRSFQKCVLDGALSTEPSLLMASAIRQSVLRYDTSGNPALHKGHSRGRIDPVSATVIACGLYQKYKSTRKPKKPKLHIVQAA